MTPQRPMELRSSTLPSRSRQTPPCLPCLPCRQDGLHEVARQALSSRSYRYKRAASLRPFVGRAEGEDREEEGKHKARRVEQEGKLRHASALTEHVQLAVYERACYLQDRDEIAAVSGE